MQRTSANTRIFLENQFKKFHKREFLYSDPLEWVHTFKDPRDQEIVGLFASLLAYGNVKQIKVSVGRWLSFMKERAHTPTGFIEKLRSESFALRVASELSGVPGHRFNTALDFLVLSQCVAKSYADFGSISSHFSSHHSGDSIEKGLDGLCNDWKRFASTKPKGKYFNFLLASPQDGSTCKRICMYLRWMVRSDELDAGIWGSKTLLPKHLMMPLDVHTSRLSKKLGLTKRKTVNWRTVCDVTQTLRTLDPEDPIRFDFSLCRVGIVEKRSRA